MKVSSLDWHVVVNDAASRRVFEATRVRVVTVEAFD